MSTFVNLVHLYESFGFSVQSSLSPAHFPGQSLDDIPFSYLFSDGERMCKGGGISLAEIVFFEALFEAYRANNIFVIGNAFGWSTLALALINPEAKVVAIDYCPRPNEVRGLEVTNSMGRHIEAAVVARKGKSPEAVKAVAAEEFEGPIEFAFVDGGHTNDQIQLDFQAVKEVASERCVYVFHDVINFGLVDGFVRIAQANPQLVSSILLRTPSGMAISYPQILEAEIGPVVRAFTETDERSKILRQEGRDRLRNS